MKSNTKPNQTFAYIEHMLIELRLMSEKQDAPVLAYLIEMAIIEAKDESNATLSPSIHSPEQVEDIKQLLSS